MSLVGLGRTRSCLSRVRASVRLFFFFPSGYALVMTYAVYSTRVSAILLRQPTFVFSYFCLGTLQFQTSSMRASRLRYYDCRCCGTARLAPYRGLLLSHQEQKLHKCNQKGDCHGLVQLQRGQRISMPVSSNISKFRNETEGQER